LPLGISFYTFQQIAYIVDAYRKRVERCEFWEYVLFVIYFPQLVAGPIVHYQEILPQFHAQKVVNWETLWKGIFIFICGLFKKIVIADSLAPMIQQGYADVDGLGILSAWSLSLGYTFQLYFDFSGYADMAIGSGLLFGIKLPENFNSPYQALNIQDFWRRWHMSLSAWLKNYVYFPLGGSRCSTLRTCVNLFLTFFIGGIWHCAGWTFIVWGTLHGLAALIHRIWTKTSVHLNKFVAWFVTFNFVNIAWIFFRANSFHDACLIIKKMFDLHIFNQLTFSMSLGELCLLLRGEVSFSCPRLLKWITICSTLCLFPNVRKLYEKFGKPHVLKTLILVGLFFYIFLKTGSKLDFLYWQF